MLTFSSLAPPPPPPIQKMDRRRSRHLSTCHLFRTVADGMPVGHLGNARWVCAKIMKTGRQDELQKEKENNKIRAKETKREEKERKDERE